MACVVRRSAVPSRSSGRPDWSSALRPLPLDCRRSLAARWTRCSVASVPAADCGNEPDWSVVLIRFDLWSVPAPPCPHWPLDCFSLIFYWTTNLFETNRHWTVLRTENWHRHNFDLTCASWRWAMVWFLLFGRVPLLIWKREMEENCKRLVRIYLGLD